MPLKEDWILRPKFYATLQSDLVFIGKNSDLRSNKFFGRRKIVCSLLNLFSCGLAVFGARIAV